MRKLWFLLAFAVAFAGLLPEPASVLAETQAADSDRQVVVPPWPPKGGKYLGPQDVVPTADILPSFDPNGSCEPLPEGPCMGSMLPQSCGPTCDALKFEPSSMWDECVGCSGSGQSCFLAQGYDLTFGALRNYCSGEVACPGSNGSFTVCLEAENVCEVHVFESLWLSYGYFPNKPLCMPVSAQVCLNGQAWFQPPVAFSSFTRGGYGCGPVNVCLTLRRDCLCSAVHAYESALRLQPGDWSTWDSKWFFHVGFTTCKACDGCR